MGHRPLTWEYMKQDAVLASGKSGTNVFSFCLSHFREYVQPYKKFF